jgi:hypothetical protein
LVASSPGMNYQPVLIQAGQGSVQIRAQPGNQHSIGILSFGRVRRGGGVTLMMYPFEIYVKVKFLIWKKYVADLSCVFSKWVKKIILSFSFFYFMILF